MRAKVIYLKIIVFLILDLFCIQVMNIVFGVFMENFFAWKELAFEYVGETEFGGITETESWKGTAPPEVGGIAAIEQVRNLEKSTEGFWFYEVRNEQEWEFFCSMLDIKETDTELDFSGYYVISINRELTGMQYNDECWDSEKYGCSVRPDFNMEKYEEGKLYIYRLEQNITFYYNDRDWCINRYNLDRRTFFVDALLDDDGYVPFDNNYEAVND